MTEALLILIRSFTLFFITLILIRLTSKKNLSQITIFQFISYTVVAILAALLSINIIKNFVFGLISLVSWILLIMALDFASMKSKTIHDLIYGVEALLIKDGKVMEENLQKEKMSGEELLKMLRVKGIFNLADVEFAIMESTGEVNVILKSDKKPITPKDIGQKVSPQGVPQTVILDGKILNEPLSNIGLNKRYINDQLKNAGVSLDNVFIGQIDPFGDLYLDLFDDAQQRPQSIVKELLYANIEKCQADLMSFALETDNEKIKNMYSENADKLKNIIEKLEPYLLR